MIPVAVAGLVALLMVVDLFIFWRFLRRCPPNRLLVIFGNVGGGRASKVMHGGTHFKVPLIQETSFLDLQPRILNARLTGALSKKNIRVNLSCTLVYAISTAPGVMENAAERLLGQSDKEIENQVQAILLGQLRLVVSELEILEFYTDPLRVEQLLHEHLESELEKIGIQTLRIYVRDVYDEAGDIKGRIQKAELSTSFR